MSPSTAPLRTRVAIAGAGPAGLVLAQLLDLAGIDSIVVDARGREEIENTVRAGILEHGTVRLLAETGASSRVLTAGHRHDGIELRFDGIGHRIDLRALTGRSVWLYPQHEVLRDLISTRLAAGQDIRFGLRVTAVDVGGERPRLHARDASGATTEIEAEFLVGADGSHSLVRSAMAGSGAGASRGWFHEYPFAWFGILCQAPPSARELIYSSSAAGFALVSQRSAEVQRMYFQCDPGADPADYDETRIWAELQRRVPGTTLCEGPVLQKDVLRFRSFVAPALLHGRVALVGDAAHTVPPTGAKGMNLAIADVLLLARALEALLRERDERPIAAYPERALARIWKAQHFSWWMTSMLHSAPGASEFDERRRLGELRMVTESEAGRRLLAEGYTGWPLDGGV
ncbi:MAG: 4-hydroxybenzoate 3-monooxygenase [Microbacteriaceae bacterium]